jgi:intracellular sulfur oxidation DsrE/DsrF family protein
MNSDDLTHIEQINAYVDDQLSNEVQAEILKKSQENEELSENICQTRIIKEMVKLSYHTPPDRHSNQAVNKHHSNRWQYGIAASLFLLLGSIAGWNGAYFYGNPIPDISASQYVQLNSDTINSHQVLLHIATSDPARVESALSNAERLLTANNSDEKFQLQILVNAEGIKILQADDSPYIDRIRTLAMKHENVSFLACQRSIERQKLKGIDIHLVKEASIIPEALEEIVKRLNQGWVYIRA